MTSKAAPYLHALVRAKEDSDGQMQANLATARELGVEPDDLQTGYLSVDKEYEYDSYGNVGSFKHFTVTRLKSVAIAREKAEAMAGELGASIGDVLTMEEQVDWGYGNMMANNWSWDDQGGDAAIDTTTGTFAPGSIEVRVSVGTVFELR